ncbi:hypothetical protein DPEC_G00019150, partial [Dallia pectoralis]
MDTLFAGHLEFRAAMGGTQPGRTPAHPSEDRPGCRVSTDGEVHRLPG